MTMKVTLPLLLLLVLVVVVVVAADVSGIPVVQAQQQCPQCCLPPVLDRRELRRRARLRRQAVSS